MSEIEDLRRDIIELRDWKEAVLGKCKASSGWDDLRWGGDKEGWGFVHYFIGHLNTRALEAEAALAAPQCEVQSREAIAFELWQRFAPVHHIGWADETHRADYYAAADGVLGVLRPAQEAKHCGALAEFFKWAMREGAWEGCDLDGGGIQDKAESLGLIVKTKFDPAKHNNSHGDYVEGDDYYEFAPGLVVPSASRATPDTRQEKNEREMAEGTRCNGLCKDGGQCNC